MASLTASGPDITQFDITSIDTADSTGSALGFYVNSTAPINVEDEPVLPTTSVKATIQTIARYLADSSDPQIVVSIHGYGTQRSDAETRYRKIYHYAKTICEPQTCVFFGYLWPSEKPTGDPSIPNNTFSDKIKYAISSLPILPAGLFFGGLAVAIVSALLLVLTQGENVLLTAVLVLSVLTSTLFLTLVFLRLSTYFRDYYRASNYGVLDLVELIRQLDLALAEIDPKGPIAQGNKKVKLSFLGHSMGCFVVTDVIRILSDVFDPCSVEKRPPANIGRVFCLERLILVAPDIPFEAIMPQRANFLQSSLRRCQEAYVFTNEGDLALRLASTAANYFSFPARTRNSGYRLGNVTVQRFRDSQDRSNRTLPKDAYGIVNVQDGKVQSPYCFLEIRASDQEHQTLDKLRPFETLQKENTDKVRETPISDLFTYFDCTDYIDVKANPDQIGATGPIEGIMSYALRKSALNLIDYAALCLAYFFSQPRNINVHGAYFDGLFSQQVMYKLAFTGFGGLMTSLSSIAMQDRSEWGRLSSADRLGLLQQFAQQCGQKQIQVVLAPIRYQVDILNEPQAGT